MGYLCGYGDKRESLSSKDHSFLFIIYPGNTIVFDRMKFYRQQNLIAMIFVSQ